jgi:hypothetical protein
MKPAKVPKNPYPIKKGSHKNSGKQNLQAINNAPNLSAIYDQYTIASAEIFVITFLKLQIEFTKLPVQFAGNLESRPQ